MLLLLLAKHRRGVYEAWQPPALSPPLFSSPLSSILCSRSSVWASPLRLLLLRLIELLGRRARLTAASMWGVPGAGGHPPLWSPRRVSFSLLQLHEWTWLRLGLGARRNYIYREVFVFCFKSFLTIWLLLDLHLYIYICLIFLKFSMVTKKDKSIRLHSTKNNNPKFNLYLIL